MLLSKTNVFMATKNTGYHQKSSLISLGMVTEHDERFYAEFTDYDKSDVDEWTNENVIKNLWCKRSERVEGNAKNITTTFSDYPYVGDTEHLKHFVKKYLSMPATIQIWGDYSTYDWMLFNNIFGSVFDLPSNVNYIPLDICTMFHLKGKDQNMARESFVGHIVDGHKHNALYDARVIKACYDKLVKL